MRLRMDVGLFGMDDSLQWSRRILESVRHWRSLHFRLSITRMKGACRLKGSRLLCRNVFTHWTRIRMKGTQNVKRWRNYSKRIQTEDMELLSQKAIIASQFLCQFLMDAINYFSAQVSRLHGGAQLENRKYKKRNISAVQGQGRGGRRRTWQRSRSLWWTLTWRPWWPQWRTRTW